MGCEDVLVTSVNKSAPGAHVLFCCSPLCPRAWKCCCALRGHGTVQSAVHGAVFRLYVRYIWKTLSVTCTVSAMGPGRA